MVCGSDSMASGAEDTNGDFPGTNVAECEAGEERNSQRTSGARGRVSAMSFGGGADMLYGTWVLGDHT